MNQVLILAENSVLEKRITTLLSENNGLVFNFSSSYSEFVEKFTETSPDACVFYSDTTEESKKWLTAFKQTIKDGCTPIIILSGTESFNQIPSEFNASWIDVLPSEIPPQQLNYRIRKLIQTTDHLTARRPITNNDPYNELIERLVTEISTNLDHHLSEIEANNTKKATELLETKNRFAELQKILSADFPVTQQTKQELFLSKKFYRQIFENVQDGIVLYDAESFRLIDLNKRAHEDLGYTREEFFLLSPKDFTVYEDKQRETVLSELFRKGSIKYKVRHKHKDNSLRTRIMQANLLSFESKKYILGILHDISDLVEKEQEIVASERKIKEIQSNLPIGIFSTSIEGRILYVNSFLVELIGAKNSAEVVGTSVQDFYINPEGRKVMLDEIEKSGKISNFELQAKNFQGRKYWARANVRLIRDKLGKPIRLDGTLEDISEQKKSDEALKKAKQRIGLMNKELRKKIKSAIENHDQQQSLLVQKSKLESIGELAAGIAHEINQPLGIMAISIENLQNRLQAGTADSDYLNRKFANIDKNITRIRNIIDHIRIFSRDQEVPTLDKININKVVNNTLSMIQTQYKHHNIQIELDITKDTGFTVGNKFKLEQALLNILSNSRYALEEKATLHSEQDYTMKIWIKTWNSTDKVGIAIKDNGMGIRKKDQDKIFDPFFTTKPEGAGTGLGLSIAFGIIKEMHGEILLKSNWNQYTQIEVILPRFPEN